MGGGWEVARCKEVGGEVVGIGGEKDFQKNASNPFHRVGMKYL